MDDAGGSRGARSCSRPAMKSGSRARSRRFSRRQYASNALAQRANASQSGVVKNRESVSGTRHACAEVPGSGSGARGGGNLQRGVGFVLADETFPNGLLLLTRRRTGADAAAGEPESHSCQQRFTKASKGRMSGEGQADSPRARCARSQRRMRSRERRGEGTRTVAPRSAA